MTSGNRDYSLFLKLTILFSILAMCVFTKVGSHGDIIYWKEWGGYIINDGIGKVYSHPWVNYNPIILYCLAFFAWLQGSIPALEENIRFLRDIFFLFDIATVFMLGRFLYRNGYNPLIALYILLNIAFLYNTMIWSQVDTVYTFFIFVSLISAYYRKGILSIALLLVALNVKLQAIVFVPLILLAVLPEFLLKPRKVLGALGALVLTEALIMFPFARQGYLLEAMSINFKLVDSTRWLSVYAFNFWCLISKDFQNIFSPDTARFLFLDMKQWGLLMFFSSSAIALIPVLRITIKCIKERQPLDIKEFKTIALCATLLALNFFFFNTQMHERYSHPAVLLSGVYCLLEGNYVLYILVSLSYFLNMEKVLQFLGLKNYQTILFDPHFIAALFAISMLYGYFRLYRGVFCEKQNR